MFDAHLEIQLVYAEYTEVEPRLLELIQKRIAKTARVDHGLFAIASLDRNVERLLRRRRSAGGFFGRAEEFQQIISAIYRGQYLGVFGLRKTGKTSLLNYVAGRRREGGRPVVWVEV